MVPEDRELMSHYEEAAARGELGEEYDGLEVTLEQASRRRSFFRPAGAGNDV